MANLEPVHRATASLNLMCLANSLAMRNSSVLNWERARTRSVARTAEPVTISVCGVPGVAAGSDSGLPSRSGPQTGAVRSV